MDARGWQIAGVSVAGLSHVRAGRPCQDAHEIALLGGAILVAAVADGAGSAPRADMGAQCAARHAIDFLSGRLAGGLPSHAQPWRDLLADALQHARQAVQAIAQSNGCGSPADFATTLLVAVATDDTVAACQIGDGAVVARLSDGTFRTVTRPPLQEYLNETTFLTSADALQLAQHAVVPARATGLALLTDGLQMLALKMPQATPHAPFFSPLLHLVAEIEQRPTAEDQLRRFLQSPRITDRADDDLTLVLAARNGA